jgi:hypothetical protein
MNLQEIIATLDLELLTEEKEFSSIELHSGYASDLLSCVMAGAQNQDLWVTLMSHMNIVAVAALLDLSAILVTEGARPDTATIEKANQQGVTLLLTPSPTFEVVGKLWELGIR